MTTYETPKTDWTSSDGVSNDDLNRIETNIVHLKEQTVDSINDLATHDNDLTIHKTSATIRGDSGAPFVLEVLAADPSGPAIGRMWLNTSV